MEDPINPGNSWIEKLMEYTDSKSLKFSGFSGLVTFVTAFG